MQNQKQPCALIETKQDFVGSILKRRQSFANPNLVRGFTLIEILVVISIISLLSTVIYAALSASQVQAQDAQKKETVHSVQNALELYHSTYGAYPPNYSDDLSSNTRTTPAIQGDPVSGAAYNESMQDMVDAGVLPSIPTTSSGASYGYYNTGSSAVFFTELTGGYGSISVNQVYPAMTEQNRDTSSQPPLTSSCFDPNQLSSDYLTCQQQGAKAYIMAQTGVSSESYDVCESMSGTYTCDSYLGEPYSSTPLFFGGGGGCDFLVHYNDPYKYNILACPIGNPAFCVPISSDRGNETCYWSQ